MARSATKQITTAEAARLLPPSLDELRWDKSLTFATTKLALAHFDSRSSVTALTRFVSIECTCGI